MSGIVPYERFSAALKDASDNTSWVELVRLEKPIRGDRKLVADVVWTTADGVIRVRSLSGADGGTGMAAHNQLCADDGVARWWVGKEVASWEGHGFHVVARRDFRMEHAERLYGGFMAAAAEMAVPLL